MMKHFRSWFTVENNVWKHFPTQLSLASRDPTIVRPPLRKRSPGQLHNSGNPGHHGRQAEINVLCCRPSLSPLNQASLRSLTWPRFIELFFHVASYSGRIARDFQNDFLSFHFMWRTFIFLSFPRRELLLSFFISKLLLVTIFQPCCLIRFFSLSIADYLLSFVHNMALKRPGLGRCPLGRSTKRGRSSSSPA